MPCKATTRCVAASDGVSASAWNLGTAFQPTRVSKQAEEVRESHASSSVRASAAPSPVPCESAVPPPPPVTVTTRIAPKSALEPANVAGWPVQAAQACGPPGGGWGAAGAGLCSTHAWGATLAAGALRSPAFPFLV